MTIQNSSVGSATKHGAAQLKRRSLCGKEGSSIEDLVVFQYAQLFQHISRTTPGQTGGFYKVFQLVLINIFKSPAGGFVVPTKGIAGFVQNKLFQFTGA